MEISFNELEKLIGKGEAPNEILYKGIVFKYHLANSSKEERLIDIKKYGMWNNGGYYSDNVNGCEFLLDYIEENDYQKANITVLKDSKKSEKEQLKELNDKIDKAIEYTERFTNGKTSRIDTFENVELVLETILQILKGE